MTLDELVVKLVLDATGFVKGQADATNSLAKTGESAVKSGKAIEGAALAANQGVEKLTRQFLTLFALVTGGRELKQFISELTATDAAVGRTAKNLDMSGKALSTWQGVAVAAGGSAEGITSSMSGLSNAMQTAALTGENRLAPVFRALGINLATTGGKARDVGAIMFDLNRRYNEMHLDPARFTAMMRMIGVDDNTTSLLEKSQAEFRALYNEQQKYAASSEDLDAAQKRQDGWRSLILTSTSFGRTILTAVTPAIVGVMKAVQGWADANQGWIRTAIVEKVGEFVTRLKSLDWNAIGKGVQDFARDVGSLAAALAGAAKEVDGNSTLFKAFEAFGALLIGSKVLGAVNSVVAAVTTLGAMPVPALLRLFAMNPAVLGTAAVGAVLASGDLDKIPLIGKHPDVQPQDSDLGLPGVGDRGPNDTSRPEAVGGGVWDWLKRNAVPDLGKAGEQLQAILKATGFNDRLGHGDPKVRDSVEATAKSTAGILDVLKRQVDGVAGEVGGGEGGNGAANRLLGWMGRAVGVGRGSGGYSPASGGGNTPARGALAANQKEAYTAALGEGLSPTAARALVANMSGEGLAVPGDYHMDGKHMASGIVQWDPTRSAAIKAKFGAMPHQLSVADQTRAAIWEMKNKYPTTWRALQGDNAADMIGALVDDYESPKDRAKAKAQRMGYYRGFNPSIAPASTATAAPAPTPSSPAIGDRAALDAESRIRAGRGTSADRELTRRYKEQQNTPQAAQAVPPASPPKHGKTIPTTFTSDPDGGLSWRTSDMRDPRFAPHPTPTVAQAAHSLLRVMHQAGRLGSPGGDKPVAVEDKGVLKLQERTLGRWIDRTKRQPEELDRVRALMHGHPQALVYHREVLAGVMAHGGVTTHTSHHYDYSSDTKVGDITVNSRATDAKGVADDLRPYLFQGRDARQANRGLA